MKEYSDEKLHEIKETMELLHEKFTDDESYKALSEMEQDESNFIVGTFSEMMYNYHLQEPGEWKSSALEEVCVDIMPRKVSAGNEFFSSVEPVLTAFFAYLQKIRKISNAETLTNKLKKVAPLMLQQSDNPDSWGPAKAFFMEGLKSGMLDTTNAETLNKTLGQYTQVYNQTRFKVGRNDPCPCGSSKKYKKCCGGA